MKDGFVFAYVDSNKPAHLQIPPSNLSGPEIQTWVLKWVTSVLIAAAAGPYRGTPKPARSNTELPLQHQSLRLPAVIATSSNIHHNLLHHTSHTIATEYLPSMIPARSLQPLRAAARSTCRMQARHATTATKPRAYPTTTSTATKYSTTPRPSSTTSSAATRTTTAAGSSASGATPAAATASKTAGPRIPLAQTTGEHIPDAPGFGKPSALGGATPAGASSADSTTTDLRGAEAGPNEDTIDWSSSYHGLGTNAFPAEVSQVLMAPIDPEDVEVKPDGIIYLPEIKYRRILNNAFGPGAWGLAPRGQLMVQDKLVTREYALIVHGR